MSPLAAAADPGIFGTVDNNVSTFGAVAVFAVDRQVANDDAAADARTQREQHHAVEVAAFADPELAIGGGVGVVLKRDRQAAMGGHPIAQRKIVPALEVYRLNKSSAGNIHCAGRAEADPDDGRRLDAGLSGSFDDGPAHPPGGVFRPLLHFRGDA